jgi:hypothetical protein
MRLFTRIYAAQFYYNLCDSYAKSTVGTVLASFDELSGRKDYKGIYLFLSLQYDQLRKPLPDPVWWLMGSPKALKIFSIGFVESLTEVFREEESYVQADDRNDELNEKQRQKLLSLFALMLQAPVSVMREPYVKHFTLERYSSLYELRAKSKTLVRIIFTMTPDGDVLFLTPFVKQHRRDTMQALESSLSLLDRMRDGSCSYQELSIEFFVNGGKTK